MVHTLFTGTYTVDGKETSSVYAISKETSVNNFSEFVQIWNFTLEDQPGDYVYYFGSNTQRINSYDTTPKNKSILNEEVFLTITRDDVVIGSLNAKTTYPDEGTGSISEKGTASYPTFTASGILRKVIRVRIDFLDNIHRKVYFLGC